MERLPAEPRLEIFRLAMRSETSPIRVEENNYAASTHTRVDVALFAVGCLISSEAQDAFFELKIFTICEAAPGYSRLALVCKIRINVGATESGSELLARVEAAFEKLAHLQTITVDSVTIRSRDLSVTEFLAGTTRCVGLKAQRVGVYEVLLRTPIT